TTKNRERWADQQHHHTLKPTPRSTHPLTSRPEASPRIAAKFPQQVSRSFRNFRSGPPISDAARAGGVDLLTGRRYATGRPIRLAAREVVVLREDG
ncbi:hypothetical protein, partial [Micromonospora fulviviridis]